MKNYKYKRRIRKEPQSLRDFEHARYARLSSLASLVRSAVRLTPYTKANAFGLRDG